MIFSPSPLGNRTLSAEELKADRKASKKFGPCGIGKEALYMGTYYIDRCFYLPWREVRRVFKRVAMSSGGFTGRGAFGTLSYLVVQFGNGREKQCRFRHEADVDRMLAQIEAEHPGIPTHSAKAERKLADAEAAEQARYLKELSPEASAAVSALILDKAFLEQRPSLSNSLTSAAKQKRIADNIKPSFLITGTILAAIGILVALYGFCAWLTHRPHALYFVLGGAALFVFTLSANMLPNKWTSKKQAQLGWEAAVADMRAFLAERPGFPIPAQYAHPIVLERMIRILREGKAKDTAKAYAVMKKELKALNSSIRVSQSEHDEVVVIKPLFLVCDYQDEI